MTLEPTRNPVGGHVPVAGGLAANGIPYAKELGAESVQVFVANPRSWATGAGSPAQDAEFRTQCSQLGLSAWVHAPYLINFGSPDEQTAARSVHSLRHSLRRGREIGARGVVVHTGSATGGRARTEALAQVRRLLLPVLAELTPQDPPVLLEPTAGQGSSLCSHLTDLGPYFEALDHHPHLGVCLDTCHVFAAGHDFTIEGEASRALDALQATVGADRLKLVHANDSRAGAGSRLDRHANIGAGQIGAAAFGELLAHPATAGVPFVIETPGGKAGQAADIALLKSLRKP